MKHGDRRERERQSKVMSRSSGREHTHMWKRISSCIVKREDKCAEGVQGHIQNPLLSIIGTVEEVERDSHWNMAYTSHRTQCN